jgi:uncharacterized protein YjbI with pentapeptide repeats
MLPHLDELQNRLQPWLHKNPLTLADQARADRQQEMTRLLEQELNRLSPWDRALIPDEFKQVINSVAGEAPRLTWEQQALTLLAAHPLALAGKDRQEPLRRAGLRGQDFFRMALACLEESYEFSASDWNLNPQDAAACPDGRMTVPAGYLIPWFEGNRCVRLAWRCPAPAEETDVALRGLSLFMPARELVFPGSGEGVQILAGGAGKPLLLCRDPLAAWLLYAQVGDIYAIIIATSPAAPACPGLKEALEASPLLLLPVTPAALSPALPAALRRQKEAEMLAPWQTLFPQLQTAVWPERCSAANLALARRQGLDIRAWLREELRRRQLPLLPDNAWQAEFDAAEGLKMSLALNLPDLKAIHRSVQGRLEAAVEERKGLMQKHMAEAQRDCSEMVQKQGHDLPLSPPPAEAPASLPPLPQETGPEFDRLAHQYIEMERPDLAEKVLQAKAQTFSEYEKLQGIYADGLAKAETMRAQAARGLTADAPSWVKNVPGAASLLSPRPLTPSLALDKLAKGESMVLEGLDFSGRDLRGLVFKEVILSKINFSRADLRGAVFAKVSGRELDFSGANLAGARMEQMALRQVNFSRADCAGLEISLSSINEIISRRTNWQQSRWHLCNLSQGVYEGLFRGLQAELFDLEGRFHQVRFEDCLFDKGGIQSRDIDGLEVKGGRWQAVGFVACRGRGLDFRDLDGPNLRFIQCRLEGVAFSGCRLRGASWRETSIKEARFHDCDLTGMCVEKCELPLASITLCQGARAVIAHSNLEGADLRGSSLAEGSLRRTRLVQADLRQTNLYGVEMYKAILGDTRLEGANLKKTLLQQPRDLLQKEGIAGKD